MRQRPHEPWVMYAWRFQCALHRIAGLVLVRSICLAQKTAPVRVIFLAFNHYSLRKEKACFNPVSSASHCCFRFFSAIQKTAHRYSID
jgi:hypothetical protein